MLTVSAHPIREEQHHDEPAVLHSHMPRVKTCCTKQHHMKYTVLARDCSRKHTPAQSHTKSHTHTSTKSYCARPALMSSISSRALAIPLATATLTAAAQAAATPAYGSNLAD